MVNILLGLYAISLFTSLAAMEILAPIIWLTGFACAFKAKDFCKPSWLIIGSLVGLVFTAMMSFYFNDINMPLLKYMGQLRWIVAYFGMVQFFYFLRPKISWSTFLNAAQLMIVILSFYSVYQMFFAHDFFRPNAFFHSLYSNSKYYRPNGMFNLPTTYAHVVSLFFAFSVPMLIFRTQARRWEAYLTNTFFILAPLSILMTFTRAAWISTSVWMFGFLSQKKLCVFKKIVGVVVLLFSIIYFSSDNFRGRVNSIFDMGYEGNSHRIYLWKANFNIFKDHPLLGIGYEADTDRSIIDSYLRQIAPSDVIRSHPHSTYINFLSGLGLFGFFFLGLFIFANLKNTIEGLRVATSDQQKSLFWGILGMQVVFLMGAFSECMLEDAEVNHQYILYLAILQAYLAHIKKNNKMDALL